MQVDDVRIAETDGRESHDKSHETQAALRLQQLSHSNNNAQPSLRPLENIYFPTEMSMFNQWNQVWPLWGEQQSDPFTAGGFQLDYSLDLPDI